MFDRYIKKILSASVYDVAEETPVHTARSLSKRLGNNILIKREDLQPIYSFKIRGAYNCISKVTQAQRSCGVVAASAGNHAQGVAFSANHLGVDATIVMPKTTPDIRQAAGRFVYERHRQQYCGDTAVHQDIQLSNGSVSHLLPWPV